MPSMIFILEEGDPEIKKVAEYSLTPKQALVNYVKQYLEKNFSTWTYPAILPGMRESRMVKDHWYYDAEGTVISAVPM